MSFPTIEHFGTLAAAPDDRLCENANLRPVASEVLASRRMMKLNQMVLGAFVAMFSAAVMAAPPVTRKGTAVLHYQTRNAMSATEVDTNVAGSLRLQQNEQGKSAKQTFQLTLAGLDANTSYTLAAVIGDDTNSVAVGTFTTDSKGGARVSYSAKNGKGNNTLPDLLNPLTDLRAISVVDGSTQTVSFAWINTAEDVHYMVKRNLTSEDATAAGSVSLIANNGNVHFKLLAGGLAAGTNYSLALNSNVVATAESDANGRLQITEWPLTAPAILDLRLLQLLDSNTNAVLSTPLPK